MPTTPPGDYLVTVSFPPTDGVTQDIIVWKYAFHVTAPIDDGVLHGLAVTFWSLPPTGQTHSLADYMSHDLDNTVNHVIVRIYNITGALGVGAFHGTPIRTEFSTLPVSAFGAGLDLPPQLAVVLATNATATGVLEHGPAETVDSTEAAIDQGAPATHAARSRPLSRYRGRMFLGPWNFKALLGAAGESSVETELLTIACKAAVDLVAASATAAAPWSIWSKADAILRPIAKGYCEDKFGTQRRRREKTSVVRSLWP